MSGLYLTECEIINYPLAKEMHFMLNLWEHRNPASNDFMKERALQFSNISNITQLHLELIEHCIL